MSIIDDIFTPVYGKPCWHFEQGYGSFLTLQIGQPYLKIREPRQASAQASEKVRKRVARRMIQVYGEWRLWIYLCDWRIFSRGQFLANSASTRKTIKQATNELDGQAVTQVSVDEALLTLFEFDLGGRVEVIPNIEEYGSDAVLWHLFEPSGDVFALRSDGQYCHMPGNTAPDKQMYQSLAIK